MGLLVQLLERILLKLSSCVLPHVNRGKGEKGWRQVYVTAKNIFERLLTPTTVLRPARKRKRSFGRPFGDHKKEKEIRENKSKTPSRTRPYIHANP
jgi:hypothetical protein